MGKQSASTSAPMTGYDNALIKSLRLSNNLTSAAIATPPELRTTDIDALQKQTRREALINAFTSKDAERELSPDIARAREELSTQIADDLEGGPSVKLSNQWLKSGLEGAIATGANVDGSFARSAVVDDTRTDYLNDRDRVQAKAAALLGANPQPVTGLDPGALASLTSQTKADNANARDNWRANILSFLGNSANNYSGALQQSMQMEAARRANNTLAKNAAAGATASNQSNGMAAGIGAAGAVAGGVLVAF